MVKKLNLDISEELWEDFKSIVPKTITLNNAILYLIGREVQDIEKGKAPRWKDTKRLLES